MKINLIGKTYFKTPIKSDSRDGIATIAAAAKQCYNKNWSIEKIYDSTDEQNGKFVLKIASSGHTSILEHASASFSVVGVSRVLSHQLVRHRIASYTQQSQRYVDMTDFSYVIPPSIKHDEKLTEYYQDTMNIIKERYSVIQKALIDNGRSATQANEDARFILSNAACTNIVVTMNYRAMINFFGLRMCTRAQWEIRDLANKMYYIMCKEEPYIFGKNAICKGSKCMTRGYCDESNSCGLKPTLNELLKAYENIKV